MPLPAAQGTEQEPSPAASEQMPLPATPGTEQEPSPVAPEQNPFLAAPGTKHEPLPAALEQMQCSCVKASSCFRDGRTVTRAVLSSRHP